MTGEFEGKHEEALRASDRPRPLDEEARRRIAEGALSAYDHHLSGEMVPVELIAAERVSEDPHNGRATRVRWLMATAAAIVAIAVFTGLTTRNETSTIEVSGPKTTPELAAEVRDWCSEHLGNLNSDTQAAFRAPDDNEVRVEAIATLADAVDSYFWLLLDSGIREGSSRTNKVGRFHGEAAITRDHSQPLSIAELRMLIQHFDDELAVTSDGNSACDIRT